MRLVIAALAAGGVMAIVAGCGTSMGPQTSATTARQGDLADIGDGQKVNVTRIWESQAVGDPHGFMTYHEAQGIWLLVDVQVRNGDSASHTFNGLGQELVVDNAVYVSDVSAADAAVANTHSWAKVDPGTNGDVMLAFDIPKGVNSSSHELFWRVVTDGERAPNLLIELTV